MAVPTHMISFHDHGILLQYFTKKRTVQDNKVNSNNNCSYIGPASDLQFMLYTWPNIITMDEESMQSINISEIV